MFRSRITLGWLCLTLSLGQGPLAMAVSITPLGLLDSEVAGGYSRATAISADGTLVVGDSRNAQGFSDPILWSAAGGLVGLGNPSGSPSYATGVGIKADGEIVVAGNVGSIARRWSSTTESWTALAPTTRCTTSQLNALAVSADGSDAWIAGGVDVRVGCGGHLYDGGYRHQWGPNTYIATSYETSSSQCDFWGVAADGTAVGRRVVSGLGDRAVYWSGFGPAQDIPALANTVGQACAISNDASTIVGYAALGGTHAFLWHWGESAVLDLGTLPGDSSSLASTVSGDGAVAGGSSTSSARPTMSASLATLWDSQGIHNLQQLLTDGGADLTGWVALNNVQSISADGTTLCGNGWYDRDAAGPAAAVQMGFVAAIPEPSTMLLIGGGMLGLSWFRRTRGSRRGEH